jgi:hypothetical protein
MHEHCFFLKNVEHVPNFESGFWWSTSRIFSQKFRALRAAYYSKRYMCYARFRFCAVQIQKYLGFANPKTVSGRGSFSTAVLQRSTTVVHYRVLQCRYTFIIIMPYNMTLYHKRLLDAQNAQLIPMAAEARGLRPGAGRRRARASRGHFGVRCCLPQYYSVFEY